jgi:hypothetical protein
MPDQVPAVFNEPIIRAKSDKKILKKYERFLAD